MLGLEPSDLILMEAAVIERLRRSGEDVLHPTLLNATLVKDPVGRETLRAIYQGYIDIALGSGVPLLLCAPTWRANRGRIQAAGAPGLLNHDAAAFLVDLVRSQSGGGRALRVGGMIGCRNDCYRPEEGLSVADAEEFHAWQVDQLAGTELDFLVAETLPAVDEALGIARAMARTDMPYVLSFVIGRDGRVLDGTELSTAIARIDADAGRRPLGYLFNCAYPTFLRAASQPSTLFERLLGCQTNASSLDQEELDGGTDLQAERVEDWGDAMLHLHKTYGLSILGGCCGTGEAHLEYLVRNPKAI